MEYRPLGRTGMQVSALCLGAMAFGQAGNPDHDECIRMIDTALDAGINFIDTADRYSIGESEEIVGQALRDRAKRDRVVVATKFNNPMGKDPNRRGGSRRWITQAVEESLRRLGTDYIDLYQQHRPDHRTDVEETVSALTDLVRAGKIRAFGTSTFPAELIVEMQWASARRNLERVRCEQPPYSIFARSIERAVLPTCARYGMGVIVWSPLNSGWLTGKYRKDQPPPSDSRGARAWVASSRWDPASALVQRKFELVEELDGIAKTFDVTLSQLATAWAIEHPGVTSAIIGPRTPEQLADALGSADLELDASTLDRIDELCPPGTDIDPADSFYEPPSLDVMARRRNAVG